MSIQEQQAQMEKYNSEAMRYMNNAKEYLSKAKKEGNLYQDSNYYDGVHVNEGFQFAYTIIDKIKPV